MTALVDEDDLIAMFTAERVAEVFSVQEVDGSTTGETDSTSLAFAIRMGSAEAERMLIGAYGDLGYTANDCPDTIKQLVGPLVMHQGMLRRPEFMQDPKKSPYYAAWEQSRADLKDLRTGFQRVSAATEPANVGGQVATQTHVNARPFTFLPSATTGEGGFNDGSF